MPSWVHLSHAGQSSWAVLSHPCIWNHDSPAWHSSFSGTSCAGLLVDEYLDPGVAFYLCGGLMVTACILDGIASILNSVTGQRSGYVEF